MDKVLAPQSDLYFFSDFLPDGLDLSSFFDPESLFASLFSSDFDSLLEPESLLDDEGAEDFLA